jgi:hypothetical protein
MLARPEVSLILRLADQAHFTLTDHAQCDRTDSARIVDSVAVARTRGRAMERRQDFTD